MSRRQPPKHPTGNAEPLSLDEEDAYAQLCLVANDHAPDDQRRLLPANTNTPKANDAPPDAPPKTPPSLPQFAAHVRARAQAVRYLLSYATGKRARQSMEDLGVTWGDIQRVRWADPQFRLAMDYVERERRHLTALMAEDAIEGLIDGSAPESVNAKAVTFALERLRREDYGERRATSDASGGGASGGGITYNITFAGNAPANLCGICATQPAPQPIIEVKGE